jgi:hypothetical protein
LIGILFFCEYPECPQHLEAAQMRTQEEKTLIPRKQRLDDFEALEGHVEFLVATGQQQDPVVRNAREGQIMMKNLPQRYRLPEHRRQVLARGGPHDRGKRKEVSRDGVKQ